MKSKDLFVIGGTVLALYLLMPKAKEVAAAGGVTTVIPMPTATPGLDVGGLFSGMASIIGAMPQQMVPEINIPEYKLPDVNIPEFPDYTGFFAAWEARLADWENRLRDLEYDIPDIPDEGLIPDIPSLIPDIPDLIPDLIPDFFGGNGKNGDGAMMGFFAEVTKAWDNFWHTSTDIVAWGNRPWYELFLDPLWLKKPTEEELEIRAESEAIFEEAGISEVTPENIHLLIEAREKVTGEKTEELPSIGTPEYWKIMLGSP